MAAYERLFLLFADVCMATVIPLGNNQTNTCKIGNRLNWFMAEVNTRINCFIKVMWGKKLL